MDNSGINYTDATRSGKRQFVLDETPTLRDQFAMAALSALIIGTSNRKCETDDGDYFDYFYEVAMNDHGRSDYSPITEQAYELADAMMEARK